MKWENIKLKIGLTIVLACMLLFTNVAQASNSKLKQQRKLFLKIEKELNKKNRFSFVKHKKGISNYPLFSYLEYKDIKNRINKVSKNEINNFLNKNRDFVYRDHLRKLWLMAQAKNKRWHNFLSLYDKNNNSTQLSCLYITAKLKTQTNIDKNLKSKIKKLWLVGKSQPKECSTVFKTFRNRSMLTKTMVWNRIELAIKNRNYRLARYLGDILPDSEKSIVNIWIKTAKKPNLINTKGVMRIKHYKMPSIITNAIVKMSQKQPLKAIKLWQYFDSKIKFKDKHWNLIIESIALNLVNEKNKLALKWLSKIPTKDANRRVLDAKLRYALHTNNKGLLYQVTHNLPDNIAQENKWKYWKAIALRNKGYNGDAEKILYSLSLNRNYYGFLSCQRLVKPYSFKHSNINLTKKIVNKVFNYKGIIRAIEFYKLKRYHLANLEWNNTIDKMKDVEKQAAARIATKLKIPNWAIMALASANDKNDLKLRFPTEFSHHVFKAADKNEVDPAWIFAVTRQESAFIPNAKSRSGAMGLMQVMPSTGRMVAKRSKIKFRSNKDLLKADKNIKIGSSYLKMMLDRYDNNHVLATAAYNAGPTRIDRWLPARNMDADAWIETIPFSETRNYVQNVLTYTVIYQLLLGQSPELKSKMLPVSNKS